MAKRKYPHHLKKYMFKRGKRSKKRKTGKRKGTQHMAKRKRKSSHRRRSGGRRHHTTRRRRRSGGGGRRGLLPPREDLQLMAAAGGYGWLENKSKADATFFLNKLPKPINQIGFAGNTALALYVAAHFTKNKWVRLLARGTAVVAAYQLGRKGAVFASGTDVFTISGGWEEQAIEDHLMGHLNPEGTQMQGVPFDDAVADAMAFSGG